MLRTNISKKYYTSLMLIIIVETLGFALYFHYENNLSSTSNNFLENYRSNYVIQNLRGDTVNTWVAWDLVTGQVLHVNIVNDAKLSPDKLFAIKDAILSTQKVTLDDSLLHKGLQGTSSTYYKGWKGALHDASTHQTKFYIPSNFEISESQSGAGEIQINLLKFENPDGYLGFTKSVTDGNQILKSTITIYMADQLSESQIGAIARHEFGHAIGLAHSSAPEDLMYTTLQTDYPYISSCDIDAINALYDGKNSSQVVCEK